MRRTKNQRLRVAHVSLGLEVGGQERLLIEFARHADRARFDLAFISLTGRGKLAAGIEELGWPVIALEQPSGLRPRLVLRLARLFRQLSCDVVHTHDDKPLLYGSVAARLAQVRRHVHTQHHGYLPQMTARQRKLAVWAGRLADAFVCVSKNSAQYMRDSGLSTERLTTLWNGIDLEKYAHYGPNVSGPAIVIARLSAEKDIATLLRAVALIVPIAGDFQLKIAGAGPLNAELRQLTTDLGLQDHVCFLGEVSNVAGLLRKARLFVLPSSTEGISLTILEAMACGLPVVATDVGGNPEVVACDTTGLLSPAKDPPSLANNLLRIWSNPDQGRRLGAAGRRRVEAHFDVRKMLASYETLYHHANKITASKAHKETVSVPG